MHMTLHQSSRCHKQGKQHLLWLPCSQTVPIGGQLAVSLMNPFCLVGKGFNLKVYLENVSCPLL